jgi:glycosyltransferase involved in cell wall biosynthesis
MSPRRTIVHLTGSPFVGGPERQMLGLAQRLLPEYRVQFLLFKDKGHSQALHTEAIRLGIDCLTLENDTPHYGKTVAEIAGVLTALNADVVCCHGYKADLLGGRAARRVGCKTIAVSHGWTGATWKVRLNEALDRWSLRRFDRVVCVSATQAEKVRRAGVAPGKIVVIRNAVDAATMPANAAELQALKERFVLPKRWLIGAAGRFSPEKGYDQFVAAAALVRKTHPEAGFILFGKGPLQADIERAIAANGLEGHFLLGGFRTDLASLWPGFDAAVLPSYSEGLPVMALEALAAGVPIVATAVGGTPEAVRDGVDGFLVPTRDPAAIADRLRRLLDDDAQRQTMGQQGRERVLTEFTFDGQAQAFCRLFDELLLKPALAEVGA